MFDHTLGVEEITINITDYIKKMRTVCLHLTIRAIFFLPRVTFTSELKDFVMQVRLAATQDGEATAKPSLPTGFSQPDLRHGVTSASTSGRQVRLHCSWSQHS